MSDFEPVKDILKKVKDSDIKQIANIADKNFNVQISLSDKEKNQKKGKTHPYQFVPINRVYFAALEAWKMVEPDKPDSFGLYLWAAKQGVPYDKLFQFAAEVKEDETIRNKGAVFNDKIMTFLSETDSKM